DLARELGQVEEAEALFAAADEEARHVLPLLYSTWGRRALFQRATFDLARGAFDACRAHLRALAPFTGGASLLQPHLTLLGVGLDLASGVGEGTRAACVEVCEAARSRKSRGLATIGAAWAFRVAMALREEPAVRVAAEDRVEPGTYLGAAHALAEARWRVRRGEDAPEVELPTAPLPELAREAELLAAERALIAGRDEEARRHAAAAARRAEETGAVPARAEALELAAAAQLLAGRREAARERGEALAGLAEASGARAWAEEAELIARLAAPADPVALARFAAEAGAAPGARARARALLGEREARLDAVDRRVLEAARASGWGRWRRAPAVDEEGGAWSVAQSGEVRLTPDRRVDLGRRPLLARLLRALGARGVATKEELVLGAWEVTSYHPLRHDNRLQVAIRTLRRELEDDPSEPRRIRTVSEGYALGGPVWFEHEDDP
ncbi:MAG TPA: helix-turn-helix domain-containing protein, partial [Polyangiaceae bacterium LLY-WYZ-15_(1-7)]|nr:helix-turn-helix domain-containing protein [Polyangiaceae bacterium LLY-WYZ-15_(1-7)]